MSLTSPPLLRNTAPLLDLMVVVDQIKTNTQFFQKVLPVSSPKKFTQQITPNEANLPAVGVSIEYGSQEDFELNSIAAQKLDIDICCTVVLNTTDDITGAENQFQMFDTALPDLMHCVYNWKPISNQRYINGFNIGRFERIENLSDDAYEVYCVWFSIPLQIDYTDGYLTQGQQLSVIASEIALTKPPSKKKTIVSIQNINT